MILLRVKKATAAAALSLMLMLPIGYGTPLYAETAQQTDDIASDAPNTVKSSGNLRAGPSPLYPVVAEIDEGTEITLVAQTLYRRWFQLENEAWISVDMLVETPPQLVDVIAPILDDVRFGQITAGSEEEATDDEATDDEATDDKATDDEEVTDDIVEVATSADGFNTLIAAIEAADLVDTLQSDGPFTVLAPTDEAFAALSDGVLDALLADPELLASVLLYHVIPNERITAENMNDGWTIETAEGSTVEVVRAASGLTLNESKVAIADIAASNGIIHAISTVLLPPNYEASSSDKATDDEEATDDDEADDEEATDDDEADDEADDEEATDDDDEADDEEATDDEATDDEATDDEATDDEADDEAAADEETDGETAVEVTADIVEVAGATDGISTLVAAITRADLVDTLQGDGPFTVLAPTDEAFKALPDGVLDALLADSEQLASVLLYHVIPNERLAAEDMSEGWSIETAEGSTVEAGRDEGSVTLNESKIITADIAASNGMIHLIDKVLLPPDYGSSDNDEAADDEAADDEAADDEATDDEATDDEAADEVTADIVEVAGSTDGISTLVAAITRAALVDTLQGDGPFTVLAPTDEAFKALPDGVLDALLADPEQLASVLLYHVIPNERLAAEDMSEGWSIETAEGSTVEAGRDEGSVTLNESKIITADIAASNGMIHLIDKVLLPPDYGTSNSEESDDEESDDEESDDEESDDEESDDEEATDEEADEEVTADIIEVAGSADEISTLVTAIEAADLVDTLQGDGPFTVLAPTDEAFASLPDGILDALLADTEQLARLLLYHVIPNERLAAEDMSEGWSIETAEGSTVEAGRDEGSVTLNESKIITADIAASNGIIHLIDNVLLPSDYELPTGDEETGDEETGDEETGDEEAAESGSTVSCETGGTVNIELGNIITCVPRDAYAWVRVYRCSAGDWVEVTPSGIGSIDPNGFIKIDGLEVDTGEYGRHGHPYRVEQWIDNKLTQSVGDTEAGEATFRVHAGSDNRTPWACP